MSASCIRSRALGQGRMTCLSRPPKLCLRRGAAPVRLTCPHSRRMPLLSLYLRITLPPICSHSSPTHPSPPHPPPHPPPLPVHTHTSECMSSAVSEDAAAGGGRGGDCGRFSRLLFLLVIKPLVFVCLVCQCCCGSRCRVLAPTVATGI